MISIIIFDIIVPNVPAITLHPERYPGIHRYLPQKVNDFVNSFCGGILGIEIYRLCVAAPVLSRLAWPASLLTGSVGVIATAMPDNLYMKQRAYKEFQLAIRIQSAVRGMFLLILGQPLQGAVVLLSAGIAYYESTR